MGNTLSKLFLKYYDFNGNSIFVNKGQNEVKWDLNL